jgi:DNA polymerase/3'-5' exonuclease PolX
MDYERARAIAERAKASLAPFCTRIEIAGSIRRRKPVVKDIELVAIPRQLPSGLFGDENIVDPDFCRVVERWPAIKGRPTDKYTQRRLPEGIVLDLFMANADNWGAILLIRTGDRDFSAHMIGSVLPRQGYRQKDGYVWKHGVKVPVPEEIEVFRLAGMDFVEPSQRVGRV